MIRFRQSKIKFKHLYVSCPANFEPPGILVLLGNFEPPDIFDLLGNFEPPGIFNSRGFSLSFLKQESVY